MKKILAVLTLLFAFNLSFGQVGKMKNPIDLLLQTNLPDTVGHQHQSLKIDPVFGLRWEREDTLFQNVANIAMLPLVGVVQNDEAMVLDIDGKGNSGVAVYDANSGWVVQSVNHGTSVDVDTVDITYELAIDDPMPQDSIAVNSRVIKRGPTCDSTFYWNGQDWIFWSENTHIYNGKIAYVDMDGDNTKFKIGNPSKAFKDPFAASQYARNNPDEVEQIYVFAGDYGFITPTNLWFTNGSYYFEPNAKLIQLGGSTATLYTPTEDSSYCTINGYLKFQSFSKDTNVSSIGLFAIGSTTGNSFSADGHELDGIGGIINGFSTDGGVAANNYMDNVKVGFNKIHLTGRGLITTMVIRNYTFNCDYLVDSNWAVGDIYVNAESLLANTMVTNAVSNIGTWELINTLTSGARSTQDWSTMSFQNGKNCNIIYNIGNMIHDTEFTRVNYGSILSFTSNNKVSENVKFTININNLNHEQPDDLIGNGITQDGALIGGASSPGTFNNCQFILNIGNGYTYRQALDFQRNSTWDSASYIKINANLNFHVLDGQNPFEISGFAPIWLEGTYKIITENKPTAMMNLLSTDSKLKLKNVTIIQPLETTPCLVATVNSSASIINVYTNSEIVDTNVTESIEGIVRSSEVW